MKVHDEIEEDFSNLRDAHGSKYTVTSCADGRYNCLSWATGDITNKWDSTLEGVGYYWPPGIGRNDTPDEWAQIFVLHGYQLTTDRTHEHGFEKVAIYASHDGPDGALHAARQLRDGNWTSKLGDGSDIEHADLQCLEGELFGTVMRVLKKYRPDWDQ